jgi:hypothetical protein
VDLPRASVCSRSPDRLRIRIDSRKGDPEFFRGVVENLSTSRAFRRLEANALTGSVLLVGEDLTIEAIADHARARRLFDLAADRSDEQALPLLSRVVPPVQAADRKLLDLTGGRVDLPSGIFLALVLAGVYQIIRGQFRVPPWYTAFWYAFGLLSMFVVKKSVSNGSTLSSD